MTKHKDSVAAQIRKYKKDNPSATLEAIAKATGATLQRVSNVLSIARRKAGLARKRKSTVVVKRQNITAGVRLDGGYYSLEKLRDIVKALELLNKISGVAKANND